MIDLNTARSSIKVRKLVDESRASTTTADDAELFFNAEANSWYEYEFNCTVAGTATLGGMRAALTLPAGGEGFMSVRTNVNTTLNNSSNTGVISALIPAASMLASQIACFYGKFKTTNAGTVALNWGQNTTAGSNPTTLKAGSELIHNKLT